MVGAALTPADTLSQVNLEKPPVIDLAGLEGPNRAKIGKEILEACETWGFFQCVNHGVDVSVVKAYTDAVTEFFKLPIEEKTKYTTSLPTFEGYSNPSHKEKTGKMDRTQAGCEFIFHLRDPDPLKNQEHEKHYPAYPPNFKPAARAYCKEAMALNEGLLAVVSEALGLESNELIKGVEGGAGPVRQGIRANHYIPKTSKEENAGVELPSHTDIASMLTLLFSDEVPGLEVRNDNEWVLIDPVPGAYIVNVGDHLEILSNGRCKSVEHRGIPHETRERYSHIAITFPNAEAKLGPIPKLVDESHPALYVYETMMEKVERFNNIGYEGKSMIESAKLGPAVKAY